MPRAYSLERIAGACAVLCLAISALLLGQPSFSNASLPVRGITDPVIAIQAARSIVDVDYVLGEPPSPDREVMRFKERIGFAFTAAYTALFLALSILLLRSAGIGRILAPAAIVCSLAAAGFNVAGNLAVLRILDLPLEETTPPMINAIRSAGFVSWTLAALALLFLSVYFFRLPKLLPRATGALFAATALMQLYGLRDGQFLVLASVPAGLALLAIAIATLLPRRRSKATPALLLLLLAAPRLHAEIKEVRTYRTHEPRDRKVLFAMAVAPNGDVLSLVAKKDGRWRLTRIRNWLDKNPADQTIDVPGVAVAGLRLASTDLLTTRDGNFAIGIATGVSSGIDNVVSVVELQSFSVRTTIHQNGNLTYFTDRAGRLVAQETMYPNRTPILPDQASTRATTLRFFTLPDLSAAASCRFTETLQGRTWSPHDLDCGPSLSQLLDGLNPPLTGPPPCFPAGVTPDGQYRRESCNDFHRNAWGNPVVTDLHENIYSTNTGALAGTVKETTRDSVNSRFAPLNNRDYLLVLEGGTGLKVYEITDAHP